MAEVGLRDLGRGMVPLFRLSGFNKDVLSGPFVLLAIGWFAQWLEVMVTCFRKAKANSGRAAKLYTSDVIINLIFRWYLSL